MLTSLSLCVFFLFESTWFLRKTFQLFTRACHSDVSATRAPISPISIGMMVCGSSASSKRDTRFEQYTTKICGCRLSGKIFFRSLPSTENAFFKLRVNLVSQCQTMAVSEFRMLNCESIHRRLNGAFVFSV